MVTFLVRPSNAIGMQHSWNIFCLKKQQNFNWYSRERINTSILNSC